MEFKILSELTRVIHHNKVKNIELIGKISQKSSKTQLFYEKIINGEIENDQQAAEYFFNDNEHNRNYKALKNRLSQRLINTSFFIDVKQSNYSEYQKAYYNCWKGMAAAKILFGKSAKNSGTLLLQKIIKPAIKFELTDLIVEASRVLRLQFGSLEGSISEFNFYNKLFKDHTETLTAESLAEEYYAKIATQYINMKSSGTEIYEASIEYFDILKPYLLKFKSLKLHLSARLLLNYGYISIGDYHSCIKNCEEAIRFFRTKDYMPRKAILLIFHHQLVCYLWLKSFEESQKHIDILNQYLTEGSTNWFSFKHTFFLIAMHTQNYDKALLILEQVLPHKNFKLLPSTLQEKFKIDEAYINYLLLVNQIKSPPTKLKSFKIKRFLNEVPLFSKAKKGMNIPILIIQVLFLIVYNRGDEAIDRIDAVTKYCNRHLRKDENFRSNCFIKMLLQIPASNFNRVAFERKAQKYRARLQEMSIENSRHSFEIEIIPYETLWELTLDALSGLKKSKRR